MKIKGKIIKTPVGEYQSPLNPHFKEILSNCNTVEDLFNIVEYQGFIDPDAFNELIVRGLCSQYKEWKNKK